MATLTDLRDALAGIVEDVTGEAAFGYLLERPIPPVSLVTPSNPYIVGDEGGNAFREFRVNFRIDVIAPTATNEKRSNDLDDLVVSLIAGLETESWLVGNVSAPYGLEANGTTYLAVTVEVSTYTRF